MLCGLWLLADSAAAYCRMTTVSPPGGECATSGEPLSWQRQCISVSLTATLPDAADGQPLSEQRMREAVDAALATWTGVECAGSPLPVELEQTAERVTCPRAEYNESHGNANAILFPDWAGLPLNAFALTMVWHDPDTGEIFDADIQMNRNNGTPAFCAPPCAPGEVDVQTILTHELGHFLGLAHSDVRGATLDFRQGIGEVRRDLHDDDRDGACNIFQTLPTPTCNDDDFAPNQGFAAECRPEEPEEAAMNAADAGPAAGPEPTDPPTDDPAAMNRSKTGGGLCSASGPGASRGRPPGHALLLAWIFAISWAGFRRRRAR